MAEWEASLPEEVRRAIDAHLDAIDRVLAESGMARAAAWNTR